MSDDDNNKHRYAESSYQIVLGLPDGHDYLEVMSRVLRAVKKEFDDVDHGILFVRGVNLKKQAKELTDLNNELADWKKAYIDLKAQCDAGRR